MIPIKFTAWEAECIAHRLATDAITDSFASDGQLSDTELVAVQSTIDRMHQEVSAKRSVTLHNALDRAILADAFEGSTFRLQIHLILSHKGSRKPSGVVARRV